MRYLFMFIILLVSPATRALAQPATLECAPPTLIGMLSGLQTPTAITVEGDYAYIVEDTYTFVIVDLSNPASPQLIARTDIPGPRLPFQITINADAAYLHHDDNPGGIYIYNIEDKADPWFVRAITTDYGIAPLSNTNERLFAYESTLNIARPFAPGVDYFEDPDFYFEGAPIFTQGNQLITENLYRYDITNPLAPIQLTDFSSDRFSDFNLRYEHPYLVDDNDNAGLFNYIFYNDDITRIYPRAFPTNGFTSATLRGGILFAANGTLDVYADSLRPLQIASLGPDSGMIDARLIRQLGDNFLITSDDSLAIYTIPTNPISSGNATNIHTYIEMMDDLIILGSERYSAFISDVDIIDASDPVRPVHLDRLTNSIPFNISQGLATAGNQLFVALNTGGLAQIEIIENAEPTLLATYHTGIDPDALPRTRDIEIRDNLAFVVDQTGKLTVYEFLSDASLSEVASLEITALLQRITLLDDLAFVCSNNTAYLVDISDPLNPTLESSIEGTGINTPYFTTADRHGDLLYTAEYSNGYRIFDISDLSDPFELAHFEADVSTPAGDFQAFAYDIELDDDYLYLAMSSGGFAIYDNTNPFNPMLRSHIPAVIPQENSNTLLREFIKRDDTIYIASGQAGLRVLSLSGCSLPCAIDFNNDGALNFYDVTLFIQAYTSENPIADLNSDGQFNFFDVANFLALYNKGCP